MFLQLVLLCFSFNLWNCLGVAQPNFRPSAVPIRFQPYFGPDPEVHYISQAVSASPPEKYNVLPHFGKVSLA